MESTSDTGSSADLRTGATSNLGEGEEKYSSGNELQGCSSSPSTSELTSQDHLHFMPNTTNHDHKYFSSEFHSISLGREEEDGSKISSHLEAHPTNPFGEVHHSPLENDSAIFPLSPSSQNPFLLLPNDETNNTHVATVATISEEMHQPFSVMQQENSSGESSAFGSYHDDGFQDETYDDDDDAFSGEMFAIHSSLEQHAYESSSIGNPFEVTTSNTPLNVYENHDHRHESDHNLEQGDWSIPNPLGESHVASSNQHSDPLFTLEESTQNQRLANATDQTHEDATAPTNFDPHLTFPVSEQGHHNMASSNSGTDFVAVLDEASVSKSSTKNPIHSSNEPSKVEANDSKLVLESSDDDTPNSSMHKHEQNSSDLAGNYSSSSSLAIVNPHTNNLSETQNPPVQVMERAGDPATTSNYRIPSHVFARDRSNTQWSTASNESLFSIQMGNMSFSSEMPWYYRSGELDTKTSDMHKSGSLATNQPPLPPPQPSQPPPVSKFNNMSQRIAEQHEGWRVAEEKAAETMREVIREESLRKVGLSVVDRAPHLIRHCDSNDYSNHSNVSTKSFAFKVSTDGDNTLSSKFLEEIRRQQKQSEQQTTKETPIPAQAAKSTTNAPQNRWLSCFTCCH